MHDFWLFVISEEDCRKTTFTFVRLYLKIITYKKILICLNIYEIKIVSMLYVWTISIFWCGFIHDVSAVYLCNA